MVEDESVKALAGVSDKNAFKINVFFFNYNLEVLHLWKERDTICRYLVKGI